MLKRGSERVAGWTSVSQPRSTHYQEVDTVQACRDGVRKGKAHWELNLVKNTEDNKEGFNKCISSKR